MIHSINYAELESLSTQTPRSFAAEIIGELNAWGNTRSSRKRSASSAASCKHVGL